jgi:plastocyanin
MDTNKFITVALALTVMVGMAWAFMPKGKESVDKTTLPAVTPAITANQAPEVTPTGKKILVKIDRDRGYLKPLQKDLGINPGDEVIWENEGTYSLILVSSQHLFEDKILDNGKIQKYLFKKSGTYSFNVQVNNNTIAKGTITVTPQTMIQSS